jgi:hypothetical protein
MVPAALGFRVHSGWAAAVAISLDQRSPIVIDRRRIEMADRNQHESVQPYHRAAELDLKKAELFVRSCLDQATRLASEALRGMIDHLNENGYRAIGSGILQASGRPATTLAATLASHAMIHTAEGEHFRQAVACASEQCDLPVTRVKERELYARAEAGLALPANEVAATIARLGKTVGPPWRQDEKLAALIAWLVVVQ